MKSSTNYHFKIGEHNCVCIQDSCDAATVADIVKDVSVEEWDQTLRAHGYSPSFGLDSNYNNLYINTGSHRILVDAGIGQWIFPGGSALVERLAREGISPSEIDWIVITHTDSDHVGGLLTAAGEPQFPNARCILPKALADTWCDPEMVAGLEGDAAVFSRKVLPVIRDQIDVVPEGEEFLPGFRLHKAPGHRAGHTAIEITSSGETLLHLADTIGHPLLLEVPAWEWVYDEDPAQAMRDKKELLALAIEKKALVFAAHMPFPGLGHIVSLDRGWKWIPINQGQ